MAESYMLFRTVEDFLGAWANESEGTRKILGALTDASLKHAIAKDHRDIGRVAWHLITSISEMANRTGLKVDGPSEKDPLPTKVVEIQKAYDKSAGMLLEQVRQYWTDETLKQVDDMYGEEMGTRVDTRHSYQPRNSSSRTIDRTDAFCRIAGAGSLRTFVGGVEKLRRQSAGSLILFPHPLPLSHWEREGEGVRCRASS